MLKAEDLEKLTSSCVRIRRLQQRLHDQQQHGLVPAPARRGLPRDLAHRLLQCRQGHLPACSVQFSMKRGSGGGLLLRGIWSDELESGRHLLGGALELLGVCLCQGGRSGAIRCC